MKSRSSIQAGAVNRLCEELNHAHGTRNHKRFGAIIGYIGGTAKLVSESQSPGILFDIEKEISAAIAYADATNPK